MIIIACEPVEDGRVPSGCDSLLYMINGVVQGVYRVIEPDPEVEAEMQRLRDEN